MNFCFDDFMYSYIIKPTMNINCILNILMRKYQLKCITGSYIKIYTTYQDDN